MVSENGGCQETLGKGTGMRKIAIPIAAVLVLGVATAVMARGAHRSSGGGVRSERTSLLGQVLDELIEDRTITRQQSDAIKTALEEKRSEALEEAKAALDQLKAFWEDDVLTSDEIAQLPAAERITDVGGPFAEALEDGQITKEEMDEIRSEHFRGRRWPGHHGRGPMKGAFGSFGSA